MRLFGPSLATVAVNELPCAPLSRCFRAACVSFAAPSICLFTNAHKKLKLQSHAAFWAQPCDRRGQRASPLGVFTQFPHCMRFLWCPLNFFLYVLQTHRSLKSMFYRGPHCARITGTEPPQAAAETQPATAMDNPG